MPAMMVRELPMLLQGLKRERRAAKEAKEGAAANGVAKKQKMAAEAAG